MKTKILLPIGLFALLVTSTVQGQAVKAPCETESKISVITEEDYPNFLNITDLEKYSNVIYNGLDVNRNKVSELRLVGNGKDTSLEAVYGRDGKLISAKLVKKDHPLPSIISRHLVSDSFKDWTMISNKTYVRDFDAMSTEYEVVMKKGKTKQTVHFDYHGNPISRLAYN